MKYNHAFQKESDTKIHAHGCKTVPSPCNIGYGIRPLLKTRIKPEIKLDNIDRNSGNSCTCAQAGRGVFGG